jgi:diguanylate cyclase (GGDEF)-like protein/PAS domain S-box-containing protein
LTGWLSGTAVLSASLGAVLGLLGVLWWRRRLERADLAELTSAIESFRPERARHLHLEAQDAAAAQLGGAVNGLLDRAQRAHAETSLFRGVVEAVNSAVVLHRDVVLLANSRFAQLLGREPAAIIGQPLANFVSADYAELVAGNIQRRLAGEAASDRYEVEITDTQGLVTRLELTERLAEFDGRPAVLVVATEMLATRVMAVSGRSRARATLDSLATGLLTTDAEGRVDYLNGAAERLLGRALAEVSGRPFAEVVVILEDPERRAIADPVRQCLVAGAPVALGRRALLLSRPDDKEHSVEVSVSPLKGDGEALVGTVVLLHDVTEQRGLARQMSYQASHDGLTGLVNRREFERRLAEALETAHSAEQIHVLCYLDLDRFKAVNDTSGHLAGDNMLREIASLAKDAVRDSDTVARIGGDEFALLLSGCPLEKAIQIAEDVSHAIRDYRFVWKDKIFTVGVSIGLVEVGRESGGVEDVLSAADSACYVAKSSGPGRVHVYSAHDEAVARHRGEIQWLQRLQHALRDGRFLLYTQPIVASHAGPARGPALEVLVRLNDEQGRLIAPGEFLKAAERYRLMSLVDRWVVQTALAALGRGGFRLPPGRSLAINVSGQTLGDATFLEFVVECLDRTGVAPGQVCFEVTEASVVANLEHARRFIGVLHGMGCQFALDDFGSGLGSFANLKSLAMDYLKIDGLYMRNLAKDSVNQAMVQAMIKLARSLDFKVIAEQVEDQPSLDAARAMGIDFCQGYVLGRPTPMQTAA